MRRTLTPWLMTLLLAVGQGALLLHEADLDHGAGDELCQICLGAQGLDADLVDATQATEARPVALRPDSGARTEPVRQRPCLPPSRAPPHSCLHT